jgi:hypothetical protein
VFRKYKCHYIYANVVSSAWLTRQTKQFVNSVDGDTFSKEGVHLNLRFLEQTRMQKKQQGRVTS